MIALLQRVAQASVVVNEIIPGEKVPGEKLIARIGPGTLALIGIERGDGDEQAERLLERILAWRMFDDPQGRMNFNLAQSGGQLMLVPQFTLAADTNSGHRPSFTPAAPPAEGKRLFDLLVSSAQKRCPDLASGVFGADMQVSLVNDGPVTFWLQVRPPS
jgi:D-aminoacyl-tRNA deacylase